MLEVSADRVPPQQACKTFLAEVEMLIAYLLPLYEFRFPSFCHTDYATFSEAAERGNLVPMFRRIFSDQLTPVLAYKCLVRGDDKEAPSFLLESVEDGIRAVRTCCHCPDYLE